MRTMTGAAAAAALLLAATATGALADGWADSISPYRNMSWSDSTRDYAARKSSGDESDQPASRRVAQADTTDEDRPQRRSRSTRPSRDSVARRSVAAGESGGSSGMASYYWQPQRVASGGWFNPNAMTAAHKTLPFGTRVRVTHMGNGRSVEVTINDRGPYVAGRIIDLSRAAASELNMTGQGVANVRMTVIGR